LIEFFVCFNFPTPYRALTVSHPENGWRPTRASHFSCPKWLCSFDRSVIWDSLPFAVLKYRFTLMWLQTVPEQRHLCLGSSQYWSRFLRHERHATASWCLPLLG